MAEGLGQYTMIHGFKQYYSVEDAFGYAEPRVQAAAAVVGDSQTPVMFDGDSSVELRLL